jgi:Protein of unknown function (DUF1656)
MPFFGTRTSSARLNDVMQELSLSGVFVPAALVWAVIAFLLSSFICRRLDRTRFYDFVWHRSLFDFALFVILWGGLSALAHHMAFSHAGLE